MSKSKKGKSKPYGRKYNPSKHPIGTSKAKGVGSGYMTKFIKRSGYK